MTGPVLIMDLAAASARRLAACLRARGLEVLAAGPAIGDIPGWDAQLAGSDPGAARVRLDRLLRELPPAISDSRSVQAFSTSRGNPLALAPQPILQRMVELAALELAAVERFDRLVATKRPSIVVLGCDNSHAQRATIARARQLDIPSLQIAHGIYGSHPHLSYAANMDILYADHIAAAGERAREHMLRFANDRERIHLTGALQWDELYEQEQRFAAPAARKAMGLDPARPLILITLGYAEGASSFYRAMTGRYHEIHEAIGRAVHRLPPRFQVAIRPHPLEFSRITDAARRNATTKVYCDHLEAICGRPITLSTGPLPRDIGAADVVASTGSSSVIAIAMILGRPALDIPWFAEDVQVYDGQDGVMVLENDDDLGPALAMLAVEGPARDRALAAQQRSLPAINEGHDGRAAERIAELVRDLARVAVHAASAPAPASSILRPAPLDPSLQRVPVESSLARSTHHQVIILGSEPDLARARCSDDQRALAAAGVDPKVLLATAPATHVYGCPETQQDLELVRKARRGTRRVIWTPIGADGGVAARARCLRDHIARHGHDDERRELLQASLAAGGLSLDEPRDRVAEALVAELVDLADVIIFSCDEEARRFLRRYPAPRGELAICPIGFDPDDVEVRVDPTGVVLVPGCAGDWATVAALGPLKAKVHVLGSNTPEDALARAAMLALPADAPVESRFLALAATGLPVIADVDSPIFDYLGPQARLVRFADVKALRARFAARILDAEVTTPARKLPEIFGLDRAGRALAEACLQGSGIASSQRRTR